MACELGLLNRADGSCRFSHGDSTVLASVFGPLQPKRQRKQLIDRASLEVSFRPRTGIPGQLERDVIDLANVKVMIHLTGQPERISGPVIRSRQATPPA